MDKQLKPHDNQKDPVVQVSQKEEEKTEKMVGQLKPHRGHTIFEYNKETGSLIKATFDDVVFDITKEKQQKRITINENCVYISALNLKNAAKKIAKYYGVNLQIK